MSANLLAAETSPYLLQHKDNPVHWRPWGEAVLAQAARENKPLLVSVGYSACHWCHVMAHESFEDAETAALMNELYVPVKIDREERPDIDTWLQTAASLMGESGGWPLTVFLTPKAEPFLAGTYFPKEDSLGRPAFKSVLRDVAKAYRENPDSVAPNIKRIADVMERAWSQNRSGRIDSLLLEQVSIAMAQRYDIFFGGLTGAPKFPNIQMLLFLWRAYLRTGTLQFLQVVFTTLDAICRGGIYDHVGGGFSRYAVDERWILPHFEKMLYDNAGMLELLTHAWQHNRNVTYRNRVEDTIGWLLREMTVEDGGFASSLDADSEGEEGKYYTWTDGEIDAALLGTMVPRFKQVYGVSREGNFKGRNILHRFIPAPNLTQADENLFAAQRARLLQARLKRVPPGRDDKVLADWNGMMIASLALAGPVFQQPAWLDAARRAFTFVCGKLADGNHLYHTYRAGNRQHLGFAEDYANMARAALMLFEATSEKAYLEWAKNWTRVLDEEFWDLAQGGYAYTAPRGEPVHVRIRTALDSQTPSANGIMLEVLGRLYFVTGEQAYRDRLNAVINAFAGDAANGYMQMPTFLSGLEFCALALQIVIVGPNSDRRTHDLINAVMGRSLPNRVLTVIAPDEKLPDSHPAHGKAMQNGQPTAYVCQGRACSAPVTSAVTLSQLLQLPQPAQTAVQAAAMPSPNR